MSGAGNDFIVIDNRFYAFKADELSTLSKDLCLRRVAIGADGLLALEGAASPLAAFRMIYYNADGSRGSMCGNGARCLVAYALANGLGEKGTLMFETDVGLFKGAEAGDQIRLFVNAPDLYKENVFVDTAGRVYDFLWTGTEHVVCAVEKLDDLQVERIGLEARLARELEPNGANVNYVQVEVGGDPARTTAISVRTFEKGVEAETLACGTGAIASAVVAHKKGLIATTNVAVKMRGGTLTVGFDFEAGTYSNVFLQGPAEVVYRGTREID